MAKKIPPDAFDYYFALGPGRSYQAVAVKYNVTKRAVLDIAKREKWQERLDEIHRKARENATEKALESLEQMNERHLSTLKVIQSKALAALRAMPLNSALAAVRALDLSIRQERTIRGEPSDRTAVSVEDTIKREYERWMLTSDKNTDPSEEAEDVDALVSTTDEPE